MHIQIFLNVSHTIFPQNADSFLVFFLLFYSFFSYCPFLVSEVRWFYRCEFGWLKWIARLCLRALFQKCERRFFVAHHYCFYRTLIMSFRNVYCPRLWYIMTHCHSKRASILSINWSALSIYRITYWSDQLSNNLGSISDHETYPL